MGRQGGDGNEEEDDAKDSRPARRQFFGRRTEGAEGGDEEGDRKKIRAAPRTWKKKSAPKAPATPIRLKIPPREEALLSEGSPAE